MKPIATLLTFAVAFSCLASPAQADRKSRDEEKAQQQRLERQLRDVEYILKHEADGTLSDRKAALKNLISTGVAPAEAYWQAGYIKRDDEWVSVEDRWLTPEQEQQLGEYNKARSNSIDTDEGHYQLAQWCVENGFDAQAYGHLKAVLLNNPDHEGLREMLGYQKIGHRWMNAEEFEAAAREADRLVKELQEWGPQVAEIREGLNSKYLREQGIARKKLKEITNVAAVPALRMILLPSSDICAAACVEQLCEIDHRLSSIALCEAITHLPESSGYAKQAALEELKDRPLEEYVPALLGQMQTTLTMQYQLFSRSWSERSQLPFLPVEKYRRVREIDWAAVIISNQNQHEVRNHLLNYLLRNDTTHVIQLPREGILANPSVNSGLRQLSTISPNPQLTIVPGGRQFRAGDVTESRLRSHSDRLYFLERNVRDQNDDIENTNGRISYLLGTVSHQDVDADPEFWWSWWNQQTEVEAGNRVTREVNEFVDAAEEGEYFMVYTSCFVAGTPVWTDRGPRAIERLNIGDMALSKDVETGELCYRPIIRTTIREVKPKKLRTLVTIDLGPEEIVSTGGHPFFVAGEGWVRARELKPGQFLHTPTGSIKIDSVTETPEAETYNLVIDGFHTYFVGMSQALVHDVSITSPTDAIVPGLLDR